MTKITAGAASAVLLASALAACSSSSGSSNNTGTGSGSSGGGVVSQTGTGARLSGVYSAQQVDGWIPANMYPSDITDDAAGDFSTGELVYANAKFSWPALSCTDVVQDASGPGFGEMAYEINAGQNSAKGAYYAYGFYEFQTADQAAAFVNQAAAKFKACGSFTATLSNGGTLPVTFSLGASSEAAQITSADVAVDLHESLTDQGKVVAGDITFAADGNIVVFTSAAGNNAIPNERDGAQVSEEMLTGLTAGEASNPTPQPYSTDTSSPTPPGTGGKVAGDTR